MERGRKKEKKNFRTLIRRDALFGPSSVSLKHGQTPREQTMMAQLGRRSVKTNHIWLRHGSLSFRQRPSATTRLKRPFSFIRHCQNCTARGLRSPPPRQWCHCHTGRSGPGQCSALCVPHDDPYMYSTVRASTSTVVLSRSRTKPLGSIPMNKAPFFVRRVYLSKRRRRARRKGGDSEKGFAPARREARAKII